MTPAKNYWTQCTTHLCSTAAYNAKSLILEGKVDVIFVTPVFFEDRVWIQMQFE